MELQGETKTAPSPHTVLSWALQNCQCHCRGAAMSSRRRAAAWASHPSATGRSGAGAGSGAEGQQGSVLRLQDQQLLAGKDGKQQSA